MKRQLRSLFVALATAACSLLHSQQGAEAQWLPPPPPYGGVPYIDPWGNRHYVSPGRFLPGSGIAMPGSYYEYQHYIPGRGWAYGERWIDPWGFARGNSYTPGPFGGYTIVETRAESAPAARQRQPQPQPQPQPRR